MKQELTRLKPLLDLARQLRFPLLVLLAGLVLLLLPSGGEKASDQEHAAQAPTAEAASYDLTELENRLARSLSAVEGVGEAEVLLTVSAQSRQVLAQDESQRGDEYSRTTVVLQGSDRQETTVTVQVLSPTFQGALVVCDGGGSARVRLNVVRAVSTLTGLGADHITVCARTGGSVS